MNGIMQDIGRGTHRLVEARYTFRRLFVAGLTALLCDAVGFAVLALIDIRAIRVLPALPLLTHLGQATDLVTLLRGRLTALQLMFTGCSATCPIEGALFAQAQQALPGVWPRSRPAVQWLSLSIDPLSDGPVQLAAWLQKSGALPGWVAAAPRVGDVERLFAVLGRSGELRPRAPDPHTGQVYILNRQGELAFRTASPPAPTTIFEALRGVDAERPGG